jgi:hypothetical protein
LAFQALILMANERSCTTIGGSGAPHPLKNRGIPAWCTCVFRDQQNCCEKSIYFTDMSIKQLGKIPQELTKSEIEDLAKLDISEIVLSGKYDLLKTLIELKRYDVYLNKLIETLKTPALEKAIEVGDKKFHYADAKVWVTKRVVYDYSADKIWSDLNNNLTAVKERIKSHQALLKKLDSETTEMVDQETGEIVKITPPIKREEDSLMIRL